MTKEMKLRIFLRSLLLQAAWNHELMQAAGFAWAIDPWLKLCYKNAPEDLAASRRRHQAFFNTQPYMSGLALGLTCALEEDLSRARSDEKESKAARITTLKTAVSCAMAGVGDTLFWGALRPSASALALLAGIWFWPHHPRLASTLGIGILLATVNLPALWLRWSGVRNGYEWKDKIAVRLKDIWWPQAAHALRQIARVLWVAVCASALLSPLLPMPMKRAALAWLIVYVIIKTGIRILPATLYSVTCLGAAAAAIVGWL